MTTKLSGKAFMNSWNIRIVEKLTHFGLALALDNAVGGGQKREVRRMLVCGTSTYVALRS